MKNQDKEIRRSILKAIAEHQLEIDRYNKILLLINNNGELYKEGKNSEVNNKPKQKPTNKSNKPKTLKEFPLLRREKPLVKNSKLLYRNNLQPVSWDKLIIPLLKNSENPMNVTEMVAVLFKYTKQKNRKVFNDRIYGALCYLKNKGLIKSERINGKMCYSIV